MLLFICSSSSFFSSLLCTFCRKIPRIRSVKESGTQKEQESRRRKHTLQVTNVTPPHHGQATSSFHSLCDDAQFQSKLPVKFCHLEFFDIALFFGIFTPLVAIHGISRLMSQDETREGMNWQCIPALLCSSSRRRHSPVS